MNDHRNEYIFTSVNEHLMLNSAIKTLTVRKLYSKIELGVEVTLNNLMLRYILLL